MTQRDLFHLPASSSNVMLLCSACSLSLSERELLEKGLTFIPTPKALDKLQLGKHLYNYHRRLKVLWFFDFDCNYIHLPFQNPSSWEPDSTSPVLQTLMNGDLHAWTTLLQVHPPPGPPNQHRWQKSWPKHLGVPEESFGGPKESQGHHHQACR